VQHKQKKVKFVAFISRTSKYVYRSRPSFKISDTNQLSLQKRNGRKITVLR